MRIQQDTTLAMNLQVEIAIPEQARHDDGAAEAHVVVWPAGGDSIPAGRNERWSFSPDEADLLARALLEAADTARATTA
jgi:hypothetical protein